MFLLLLLLLLQLLLLLLLLLLFLLLQLELQLLCLVSASSCLRAMFGLFGAWVCLKWLLVEAYSCHCFMFSCCGLLVRFVPIQFILVCVCLSFCIIGFEVANVASIRFSGVATGQTSGNLPIGWLRFELEQPGEVHQTRLPHRLAQCAKRDCAERSGG